MTSVFPRWRECLRGSGVGSGLERRRLQKEAAGDETALSPLAFSLVCDRVGRWVSPAMQPLLARAEALPAPSLSDSANSKDRFRNTPPGLAPLHRLARHPHPTPPHPGTLVLSGGASSSDLDVWVNKSSRGTTRRPSFPTVRTQGGLRGTRRGPARGRLRTCGRRTDLAPTLGVLRASRRAVLPAVPAGHAAYPGRPGRSAELGSQPAGFVIASPAFPPSAGPTSAGPPSSPRRAEQQPGSPEWRSPRPQRPPPGRRGAAGFYI